MKVREPTTSWTAWITPGGGTEEGESPEDTLRRELREETGLEGFKIGPIVWTRDHTGTWEGRPFRQIESFYLIEISRFTPTSEHQPEPVEIRAFRGFCWWSLDEICASEEIFVPGRLGPLLPALVVDGPPEQPIDAGI